MTSRASAAGWADDADTLFGEAYDLEQQAAMLDPRYPNAHFALGLACMWTHRPERGIGAFEEAIRLNPSFAAAHVLLGQMYLYAGRREEAIKRAEKGFSISPSDCSSGRPCLLEHITSCGAMRRPSKPNDARGRSTGIGRPVCAMSSPGWPSRAGSRRREQRLPSSK